MAIALNGAMEWIRRSADKAGALGALVSAAACPACFPALASLGAAAGLGFLAAYEALFITTLLPIFAALALLANALGWLRHRRWQRSLIGMAGPALVLAGLVMYLRLGQGPVVFYLGLGLMVAVSLQDLLSRGDSRCRSGECEAGEGRP